MNKYARCAIAALLVSGVVAGLILSGGLVRIAHSHDIVNSNILNRVLQIRVGNNTGTAFTIEVDDKQYLITAKHLTNEKAINRLEIWRRGWHTIKVKTVRIGVGLEDVIVLAAEKKLTTIFEVAVGSGHIVIGQEVKFLGFPLGINLVHMMDQRGVKIPFIKGGILSGIKFQNQASWLLVDGHNNRGFSGGPVVFKPLTGKRGVWKIAAVIRGYRIERTVVRDETGRKIGIAEGNSGILVATGIEAALKLIRKNTIGFPVKVR